MSRHSLEARQQRFADAYVGNGFNGTAAAIEAGYAENSAHVTASKLLNIPKVVAYIEARKEEISRDARMTAEDVFREMKSIALFDPAEVISATKDGVITLKKDLDDIPVTVRRNIKSIKAGKYGLEVTFYSRDTGLMAIAKWLGMDVDRLEHMVSGEQFVFVAPDKFDGVDEWAKSNAS